MFSKAFFTVYHEMFYFPIYMNHDKKSRQFFFCSFQLLKDIQKSLVGKWCSEAECVNTIKKCFETTGTYG